MHDRTLILLGAGGHASVVAESAVAAGWHVVGYLASEPTRVAACAALAVPWLGPVERPNPDGQRLLASGARVHSAVGDARVREQWCARFGPERHAVIVHPGVWVSPSASVSPGVYIGPFAVVNATAIIGHGAIINTGAIIEHGARVGAFAHVAPRATLAGMAEVGERTLVGANSVLLPFVKVGNDCIVGAGAVVHRDVGSHQTVVGIPARPLAVRA